MIILQTTDLFQAKIKSLLADYDRDTIVSLYQPLVGYSAIALYFSLWSEANHQEYSSLVTHESFLLRLQMSTGDFVKARKALEAIGLLKTYFEKGNNDCNFYTYELAAPKTPGEYFNDPLLYGLLIKYLGEGEANKLKLIYTNQKADKNGEDISSSFGEIFHPNYEDASYEKALQSNDKNIKSRKRNKIDSEFSLQEFFNCLKTISQLNENSLSKNEITMISKLAMLYDVNESTAAEHVANRYDNKLEKGKRINAHDIANDFLNEVSFRFLSKKTIKNEKNTISSNSDLANKINLFETVSPKQFLTIKQNGTIPAPSDLWIIFDLATKYKLTNPVINVIVDYVLTVKNNIFSRSLSEKIAASLARSGIVTSTDAMNYINENAASFSSFKTINKKYNNDSKEEIEKVLTDNSKDNLSKQKQEAEWESLLSSFEEKK